MITGCVLKLSKSDDIFVSMISIKYFWVGNANFHYLLLTMHPIPWKPFKINIDRRRSFWKINILLYVFKNVEISHFKENNESFGELKKLIGVRETENWE